jgi:hypothetical protein
VLSNAAHVAQLDALSHPPPASPTGRTAAVTPTPGRETSPTLSPIGSPSISSTLLGSLFAPGVVSPGPSGQPDLEKEREKALYPQRVILTSKSHRVALRPVS